MRGIPGREGLEQEFRCPACNSKLTPEKPIEPQFKVGDRVEFGFNGEKKTGTVTGLEIDNPFVTISGDDGDFYAISSSVKLLPQLMICPKAERCPVEHCYHCDKKPHKHNPERCSVRSVNCPACIPYVEQPEEQMVDVCQIIATLIRASDPNSEHEFNWSRKSKIPQAKIRAILAPYMEGSDE